MQTAIKKVYKAEILQSLLSAKAQINQLLSDVETNTSWQVFHQHTQTVVNHSKNVIRLLAEQHITICVLGKYKQTGFNLLPGDIDEIMKTYRYLN